MRQYTVDAFAEALFSGNPAAVCVAEGPLSDALMGAIAVENNLSETAFLRRRGEGYGLRWFTPGGEIDLCGHATLASAFVVMELLEPGRRQVTFETLGGDLTVIRREDRYELDFPAYDLRPLPVTAEMERALGAAAQSAWLGRGLLCVLESEAAVRSLTPDQEALRALPGLLQHVTAPGA